MPTITSISGGDPIESINGLLGGCRTLLDVGAGIGLSVAAMRVPIRIGLDIHRPYLEHWPAMEPAAIPLNLPAHALRTVFLPKTIDAVCFIDSLEHLPEKEAKAALADAECIAGRIVAIFTPRGNFPQGESDVWGMGGEEHQRHRSSWEPEDFAGLGYNVLIFIGFHGDWSEPFRRAFGPGASAVDALVAYKLLTPG